MNADKILSTTFAEHEHLAADGGAILADLHRELDGRRHRRVIRSLTALGAVASVATIAVGVAVIVGQRAHHAGAPVGAKPASAAHAPRVAPKTVGQPIAAPDRLTLAAGWLPGPATHTQTEVHNGPSGQFRGYEVKVGAISLDVLLALDPGSALPSESKGVSARDTTVNGHPGKEFAKDGFYQVTYQTADAKTASVWVAPSAPYDGNAVASAANLSTIGRHVAQSMQFNHNDVIQTSAVLTYLPAGVTIVGLQTTADGIGSTTYVLSGPDGDNAAVDVGGPNAGVIPGNGTAGRPVQGHRTEVISNANGSFQLSVFDFRPGVSLSLVTGAGVRTLDDLYRIANGVRWVG